MKEAEDAYDEDEDEKMEKTRSEVVRRQRLELSCVSGWSRLVSVP